ncbi:MAG: spore cortex biosynthesis protein YabQ [Lachnospiraceae bacterium]|nr:spore cortex biosynthesis protein YabQ [Lachnospiraceae bacterium]
MPNNQLYLFFIFVLTGLLIGILFDVFRILRKSFKTPDGITYIEDVLFWIISGILVLFTVLKFNNGEFRNYIFIRTIFRNKFLHAYI